MPPDQPVTLAQPPSSVAVAQQEIARILAELERETHALVVAVDILQVDGRSLDAELPSCIRRVHIVLGATPGSGWRG